MVTVFHERPGFGLLSLANPLGCPAPGAGGTRRQAPVRAAFGPTADLDGGAPAQPPYIDSEPSRKSVPSSQTLSSTGRP